MITKAIIERAVDSYSCAVRIPMYNKAKTAVGATPSDQLYIAHFNAPPGSYINYRVGDVVYVSFEDETMFQPIILGWVEGASRNASQMDLSVRNLDFLGKIGTVSKEELSCLEGVTSNIQQQLNSNAVVTGVKDEWIYRRSPDGWIECYKTVEKKLSAQRWNGVYVSSESVEVSMPFEMSDTYVMNGIVKPSSVVYSAWTVPASTTDISTIGYRVVSGASFENVSITITFELKGYLKGDNE